MSVDKDTESPDRSVSSLSGRTGRQWTAFFQKIWKESGQDSFFNPARNSYPDSGQNRDKQNPDSKSGQNSDSRQTDTGQKRDR